MNIPNFASRHQAVRASSCSRVSGAGWIRTYFRIWLPLLMPTLMLLAVMNFVSAAGATGSIILLASRDTMTLSLMALELSSIAISNREAASIISIFIIALTVTGALLVRYFGLRMGVRHDMHASAAGLPRIIDGPRKNHDALQTER